MDAEKSQVKVLAMVIGQLYKIMFHTRSKIYYWWQLQLF